jgi:hypothetical protein
MVDPKRKGASAPLHVEEVATPRAEPGGTLRSLASVSMVSDGIGDERICASGGCGRTD